MLWGFSSLGGFSLAADKRIEASIELPCHPVRFLMLTGCSDRLRGSVDWSYSIMYDLNNTSWGAAHVDCL
jgi:hypothetical protein